MSRNVQGLQATICKRPVLGAMVLLTRKPSRAPPGVRSTEGVMTESGLKLYPSRWKELAREGKRRARSRVPSSASCPAATYSLTIP